MSDRHPNDFSEFQFDGLEPHAWLESARQMNLAADLVAAELKPMLMGALRGTRLPGHARLFKPYMLLSGLAIESVLKGIRVGRCPHLVGAEKLVGQWSHDLNHLCDELCIDCSDAERRLLDRLHRFVLWAGRYPIPMKSASFERPIFNSGDPGAITALFQRLQSLLEAEHPTSTIDFR